MLLNNPQQKASPTLDADIYFLLVTDSVLGGTAHIGGLCMDLYLGSLSCLTDLHVHSFTNTVLPLKKKIIYLVALGLSCNMQDLQCSMWALI